MAILVDPLQGKEASDFTLIADDGNLFTLSSLKGKKIILYFYPKDDTSGCTAQACAFRDHVSEFKAKNAVIIGVSKDDTKRHQNFKNKYQLNFPLLSDTEGKICELYGVWKEKSMYGRKYFGIERSTFYIDENFTVSQVWRKVKVPGHFEEILNLL
ncbi:MAG: thioredoxin-dependent thiol peroxidase [Alphaproteobacteria bacterium]|nr:thioredoxin-dependent thiol peroxidase [Alphaproteobacteria bacterium]